MVNVFLTKYLPLPASHQTISIVYIVTAVVGVETWYKPILWQFHYRDMFSIMIVGELPLVTFGTALHRLEREGELLLDQGWC